MEILPAFADFEAAAARGENQVLWTRLVADLDTPVSLMLKLAEARRDSFLLESVTGGEIRGRYSIIGMKPDLVWRCRGTLAEVNRAARHDAEAFEPDARDPLASLRALLEESRIALPEGLPPMAAGLFGYFGYDMVRLVERLPEPNPDPLGLPDAVLMRPTVVAVVDSVRDEVTLVAPVWAREGETPRAAYARAAERLSDAVDALDRAPAAERGAQGASARAGGEPVSNTTPEAYRAMVLKAKDYIGAGDIFQVVPSQRWAVPFTEPPFALYRALRRTNPSPYMFFFNFGGYQIVGASPEVLVRVRGDVVTIRPIAGTRPRGKTLEQDAALAEELLADPKELAEHLMLIDLGRNDIGRVAEHGTVKLTDKMVIERYSHVMHIVSNVEAKLKTGLSAMDVLKATFPAGTVSGAAKVRAMEIIDELEPSKRGIYAGAVGYLGFNGDMDVAIALRTAVVKDQTLYVQAGAGIVADSNPDSEWTETQNKARAVLRAAEMVLDGLDAPAHR